MSSHKNILIGAVSQANVLLGTLRDELSEQSYITHGREEWCFQTPDSELQAEILIGI